MHYRFKLLAAYLLALDKRVGDCMESVDMLLEYILGMTVGRGDDAVYLLIYLCGCLLRIILQMRVISAEEYLVVTRAEGYRAEPVAHAVLCDHLARDIRGALNVVRRAG